MEDLGVKEECESDSSCVVFWVKWSKKNALNYLLMVHVESKVRIVSQGGGQYTRPPLTYRAIDLSISYFATN